MRNIYKQFMLAATFCLMLATASSQSTISLSGTADNFWSSTQEGAMVFGMQNFNAYDVKITKVSAYLPAGQYFKYSLWYHPTNKTGAPSQISKVNGWIPIDTAELTTTTAGVQELFSSLSFILSSNQTTRFALVGGPDSFPYYASSLASDAQAYVGNIGLYSQNNSTSQTYVGNASGALTTGPRGFIGSVTFEGNTPCTMAQAGTAVVNISSPCEEQDFRVTLQDAHIGTGQTYQWQWSTDGSNWSNIGPGPTASSTYSGNQFSSHYYRAIVTCGAAVDTSTGVFVENNPGLSGVYTINPNQPTGGNNFSSFADALAAMQCGLAAPVTLEVAAGATLTEQVTIGQVVQTSTRRLTIKGNGATLQYQPNTDAKHVLLLNDADYVTIDSLNIVSLDPAFGFGVHVKGGCNEDTIRNCNIDVSMATSTSSNANTGILIDPANTSGSAGVVLLNNIVNGGYYGIYFGGPTNPLNAANNAVRNNTVKNFYQKGIVITNQNNSVIHGNDIHRKDRAQTAGLIVGIEVSGATRNTTISSNRIHDTHTSFTGTTGEVYGIFSSSNNAAVGSENKYINNLIHRINNKNGLVYGIHNQGSNGAWYYHNTIVIDNPLTTSSSITRGFMQNVQSSNIQFRNNIVCITRTGTSPKHAMYISQNNTAIISDNNVFYIETPGSGGIGYIGTTNAPSLSDWKAVKGGTLDQNSVVGYPMFADTANGDYKPANIAIDNIGSFVSVTEDILGQNRSATTPDAGAYEFNAALPVTGMTLQAIRKDNEILLGWTTLSENNNKGFHIERSADGENFSKIGFVGTKTANGNSSEVIDYNYTDGKPLSGSNYYRLQQVDADGKTSYSNIVVMKNAANEKFAVVAVYPNPATDRLNVVFTSPAFEKVQMVVTDVSGKVLMIENKTIAPGENLFSLNVSALSRGTYFVKVLCNSGCEGMVKKFVK